MRADLIRRGLDPALIELDSDSELPPELQEKPVAVELTELYLDERAFNQHAGSRDYLDAYGTVMQPGLQNSPPSIIRLGNPTASLVEKILEPMLHEIVPPTAEGNMIWQRPQTTSNAVFISLDVPIDAESSASAVAAALKSDFREHCTTCISFPHPLRANTARLLCILPSLPPVPVLAGLVALNPARGEAHMTTGNETAADSVRITLAEAGLGVVTLNASQAVGYVLHERAADLHVGMP